MFVNCLYITFYSADDGGKLEDFAMDTEVEAFRKLERGNQACKDLYLSD